MDASNLNIPSALISKTEFFDAATHISKAISSISKYGAVVVNKNGEYYGLIDDRSLYRFGITANTSGKESAGKYAARVPSISDSTSIDDALLGFYKSRAKALPYVSGRRITGVIKRFTMLKILLSLKMLQDTPVNEAMTFPVIAIDARSSISQARAVMRDRKISRIIVLQNDSLYGIITNHDIAYSRSKSEERLPEKKSEPSNFADAALGSVSSRNLVVLDYRKSLADAARSMIENNVSSVIILRGGKPVGILTLFDIFGDVISRRRIEEQKIFISGLDESSKDYENDIREELKGFMKKTAKLHGVGTLYITLNIKRVGTRMYELHARLTMQNKGSIFVHATGYSIERTLVQLLRNLEKEVRGNKEKYLSVRKVNIFKKGMDEDATYVD